MYLFLFSVDQLSKTSVPHCMWRAAEGRFLYFWTHYVGTWLTFNIGKLEATEILFRISHEEVFKLHIFIPGWPVTMHYKYATGTCLMLAVEWRCCNGKMRPSWNLLQDTIFVLTLSLLMSYICGAPCKARNFNVLCIWTYVWQRWNPSLYIFCTMFQHWITAENYPVAQLCVNTLPATKITLITDGI
jgi:hypothetical protein